MKNSALTLVELLVVVAIIAILVAIAVPNFLEAQVRAKVSRSYADMRSISTALVAYRVDSNNYPLSVNLSSGIILSHLLRLKPLTTPIAYLSNVPSDIFRPSSPYSYLEKYGWLATSRYFGEAPPLRGIEIDFFQTGNWVLASVGPAITRPDMTDGYGPEDIYDPTNGTISL